MPCALTLFGTRPESIKLAPVMRAFARRPDWRTVNVCSSQHTDLLRPFLNELNIPVDYDLAVMTSSQTPASVMSRVMERLEPILMQEKPDVVLVQGDTSTAVAGALAASMSSIPVGHVEAGLRTGDKRSPFPEELNRRLIGQVTDWHFCATRRNMRALINEGVPIDDVYHTGNPVVDSLREILASSVPSTELTMLLRRVADKRILAVTMHRRENFGETMRGYMRALRGFCDAHEDVAIIFPVHPNPNVRETAQELLSGHDRIHLVAPLEYADFIHLLSRAWLIASDSGGLAEEIPTLGKAALILRDNTERVEAIECGSARLVGRSAKRLREMLEAATQNNHWQTAASRVINPFGQGDAGERILQAVDQRLSGTEPKTEQNLEFPWKHDESYPRTAGL